MLVGGWQDWVSIWLTISVSAKNEPVLMMVKS
jgi:hypothetical protein